MCGKQFAYVERTDDRFVDGVMPYYHRTKRVEDQSAIIDAIEAGEIDDAIVKLAVYVIGPVEPLAQATLANFADTHQYAVSGANWADLQLRASTRGAPCATCSASSASSAPRPPSSATRETTCR